MIRKGNLLGVELNSWSIRRKIAVAITICIVIGLLAVISPAPGG